KDLERLASYALLVSAGTLVGAVGLGDPAITGAVLYYLVVSTLGTAAFFMLAGLIAPDGQDESDEPTMLEAFDPADDLHFSEEDESAVVISAPAAILGASFLACTVLIA